MQILNSIIGSCSLLLFLFSLHLFYAKQGNQLLNRLLSVVFFARFGQIIIYLMVTSNELTIFPVVQKIFIPFHYAAPACLYLYISGFIRGRTHFRKFELLHFVPFLMAIIHVLPWDFSSPIQWNAVAAQISEGKHLFITERTGLFPAYFHYLGRPILMLGYTFATWHAVLTSQSILKKEWDLNKIWIVFYLSTSTFFNLIGILPLIFGSINQPLVSFSWFVILNCLVLLCVMVFVFHQPRILYGYLFVAVDWNGKTEEIMITDESLQPALIAAQKKINIMPDQLSIYSDSMKTFMDFERPYLLHDFQIADLSGRLNIPVHHCSFVINNVIGRNFRDWINEYRIRYFVAQYNIKGDRMTIEAIAHEAGFKSLATFYNAFKKETGLMPRAYFLK